MTPTQGSILLHYRLVETIGQGGMGVVWKAADTTLDRDVAVKILPDALAADPDRLARFEREAKVLASLNHPNVATVHGFHEAEGVRFLVMELVPGETLEERLKRGAMPPDEALPIARKIVDGIEYAHERGIVHRDLKPANVKLTADGGVKVLDFGLAKALAGDPTTSGPTSTPTLMPTLTSMGSVAGLILGTAAYMSPEQARGTNIDRRADIWAFGAVLFEMLAGRRAFEGDTVSDTLASVLRAPIEWEALPASTPPAVVRLLKRCLERDPKKRLRDIGEARIALDAMGTEPEVAPAVPTGRLAPPKRSLVPWALFALATIAALVLGGFIAARKPPEARVVRFTVAPDGTLSRMDWPRLSPDGRLLAFQGFDAAGKQAIWIRPVDSLTAYPLAGTEGATWRPFWSPDSRYLAYFDGRQLKKIPVAGGPPQLIGDAENGADGTWGTNGVIVFDGRGAIDPMRRISASGGKPSAALGGEAKELPAIASWPFFLPDGKHFLFMSSGGGGSASNNAVCVAGLDTPGFKRLTETGSRAEYANGYIVYVLHGTLVAHRFDPDRLELSGDPIPLADHVSENGTRALFSVSTTGSIALQPGTGGVTSELVWLDRNGKELGKVGGPDTYLDLALSPDASRLAYSLNDTRTDTHDIWVRDIARDTASRLTFDPKDDIRPVWSPDGARVIFSSNRSGPNVCMEKASNGTGDDRPVYKDDAGNVFPRDISRDGRWLALDRFAAVAQPNIDVVPSDGKPTPVRVPGNTAQLAGQFSPDGRFIAYVSNETGTPEVYVQTWPLGGGKWQISNGGGSLARWRTDGKELFYRNAEFQFFSVPLSLDPRFTAGIPQPLFKRRLQVSAIAVPTWTITPDGQRFLLNAALASTQASPFTVILNWPEALNAK
jgi:Tol biopolymer transport system component